MEEGLIRVSHGALADCRDPQGTHPHGGPVGSSLQQCWFSARCIAHIDADCFYAQVEELSDPSLRFRLLAVRQKHTVVTCSLRTRAALGNIKGISVASALRRCPALCIVNGEDLTKYRRVSDRLLQLLQGQPWRGVPTVLSSREASRAVAGSLLRIMYQVSHQLCAFVSDGGCAEGSGCSCSLRLVITPPQKQPRASGVFLPPSALRCRRCSRCSGRLQQPMDSGTTISPPFSAAHAELAGAPSSSCCCEWELSCPAFVYDVKGEASSAMCHGKRRSSDSAERLLSEPLALKPLLASVYNNVLLEEELSESPAGERSSAKSRKHQQRQEQGPTRQRLIGLAAAIDDTIEASRLLLVVAAHLTEAMRGLIFSTFGGLTTTGGICSNKTLAKMVSKEHKPSQQTLLLREHRRRFLANKALRSLPGIGAATARRLAAAKVNTCKELLALSTSDLACVLSTAVSSLSSASSKLPQQQRKGLQTLGLSSPGVCTPSETAVAHAKRLMLACSGDEAEAVEATSGAPKTVTAEDSYAARPIITWSFLTQELKRLLGRLLLRHEETTSRSGLVASSLRVSVGLRSHFHRSSRSTLLPADIRHLLGSYSPRKGPLPRQALNALPPKLEFPDGEEGTAENTSAHHVECLGQEQCTKHLQHFENPLHTALSALALQLFGKVFEVPVGSSARPLSDISVLSITFAGFSPQGTRMADVRETRRKSGDSPRTIKDFFCQHAVTKRQQRELDYNESCSACSPHSLRHPKGTELLTVEPTCEGRQSVGSEGEEAFARADKSPRGASSEISLSLNCRAWKTQEDEGDGDCQQEEITRASGPCATVLHRNKIEIISISSRESSPNSRGSLSSSPTDECEGCMNNKATKSNAVGTPVGCHTGDEVVAVGRRLSASSQCEASGYQLEQPLPCTDQENRGLHKHESTKMLCATRCACLGYFEDAGTRVATCDRPHGYPDAKDLKGITTETV
ncbi:putative DNA polymerase [Cyclospora cayetanensis]|uniref:DNA polymerase n=1 Tax=Cyclospora cayetanensis TaxID=88456 RepID=A0A1D3D636_9EIME|nr:putative DNA polymerase [Cyclospora cayetanensis]